MNFTTILTHDHPASDPEAGCTVTVETAVGDDDFIYRRFTWVRDEDGKRCLRTDWRKDESLRITHVKFVGKAKERKVVKVIERTADEFFNSLREQGWTDKPKARKKVRSDA